MHVTNANFITFSNQNDELYFTRQTTNFNQWKEMQIFLSIAVGERSKVSVT